MFSIVYHISFCPLVVNAILIPQDEMKGIWQQSQTLDQVLVIFTSFISIATLCHLVVPQFLNITPPTHVTCYRPHIWGLTDQLENCRGGAFVVSLLWN